MLNNARGCLGLDAALLLFTDQFPSLSSGNALLLFRPVEILHLPGPKPVASPAAIPASPAASTSALETKPAPVKVESKPSLTTTKSAPSNGTNGKPAPERKPSISNDKPLEQGKTRSSKTDGVKFDKRDDKTRDKCMELLYDALVLDAVARESLVVQRSTR